MDRGGVVVVGCREDLMVFGNWVYYAVFGAYLHVGLCCWLPFGVDGAGAWLLFYAEVGKIPGVCT